MRFGKRDREPHGSESDDEIFFKVVNEDTGGNEGEKKPESVLQDVGEKAAEKKHTERLARNFLEAQEQVDQAVRDRQAGVGKLFALELALRALAQAKVKQAQYNLDLRKGTEAMVDRAIAELRRAEDNLNDSQAGAEALADYRAKAIANGGIDVGGESALQIAGQRRRREAELDTPN